MHACIGRLGDPPRVYQLPAPMFFTHLPGTSLGFYLAPTCGIRNAVLVILTPALFCTTAFQCQKAVCSSNRCERSLKGVMGVGKLATNSGIGIAALSGLAWALKRFLKSRDYDDLDSKIHHPVHKQRAQKVWGANLFQLTRIFQSVTLCKTHMLQYNGLFS